MEFNRTQSQYPPTSNSELPHTELNFMAAFFSPSAPAKLVPVSPPTFQAEGA